MKKGLLFFTLISFLILGNITVYSQDNIENQNDIEILDNNNSDNIDDKKTNKEKKEKSKREKLEKELDHLNEIKYSTNNNDVEGLKEIGEQIKEVKNEIRRLFNDPEFLGTPIYNAEDFWKLIIKAIFNLLAPGALRFKKPVALSFYEVSTELLTIDSTVSKPIACPLALATNFLTIID